MLVRIAARSRDDFLARDVVGDVPIGVEYQIGHVRGEHRGLGGLEGLADDDIHLADLASESLVDSKANRRNCGMLTMMGALSSSVGSQRQRSMVSSIWRTRSAQGARELRKRRATEDAVRLLAVPGLEMLQGVDERGRQGLRRQRQCGAEPARHRRARHRRARRAAARVARRRHRPRRASPIWRATAAAR